MTITFGHSVGSREGAETELTISTQTLLKHLLILGKAGQGKSNAEMQIAMDLMKGSIEGDKAGFTFIDPLGHDIRQICSIIPEELHHKVHILHFGDTQYPRSINILDMGGGTLDMAFAFNALVREIFPGEVGNRMMHWVKYGLITLKEAESQTILGLEPLFIDKSFRDSILAKVSDPALKFFWSDQGAFVKQQAKVAEIIAPLLQNLSSLTTNPIIRRIFGQPKSTIDIRKIMNDGDILLIDLSELSRDLKQAIGIILFYLFHTHALARRDIENSEDRVPHFLFTGEVSFYQSNILISMLAECRKYGLGIIASIQSIDRLSGHLSNGLMNNSGSYMAFSSGSGDSVRISRAFKQVDASYISQLSCGQFIISTHDKNNNPVQDLRIFEQIQPLNDKYYDSILRLSDHRDGRPIVEVNEEMMKYQPY